MAACVYLLTEKQSMKYINKMFWKIHTCEKMIGNIFSLPVNLIGMRMTSLSVLKTSASFFVGKVLMVANCVNRFMSLWLFCDFFPIVPIVQVMPRSLRHFFLLSHGRKVLIRKTCGTVPIVKLVGTLGTTFYVIKSFLYLGYLTRRSSWHCG